MPLPKLGFVVTLLLFICCPRMSAAQEPNEELDSKSFKIYKVPYDRNKAVRWYLHFHELNLSAMPRKEIASLAKILLGSAAISQELRDSWKTSHGNATLDSLSVGNLRDILMQIEKETIAKLSTEEIRSKVQFTIYQREKNEKRFQDRLARMAEELAQLANEAKGTEIERLARAALDASGHVEHQGKVLPHDVAFPPLGIRR